MCKMEETTKWVSTLCIEDLFDNLNIGFVRVHEMNKNKMDSCLRILNNKSFIFIKSNLSENYERFVIYHEIGHYLMHYQEGMRYSFYLSRYKSKIEREANIFACLCLLSDEEQDEINIIELLERKGVPSKIALQYYDYYK